MALPLYTGKAILFRGVTMSIRDTVTGVQHVGIPTTDLEGTIAYYERLGFECLGIYPNGDLNISKLPKIVCTLDYKRR